MLSSASSGVRAGGFANYNDHAMLKRARPSILQARLKWALAAYAALAMLAGLTLDGNLRLFLWILLAGLSIRSWAAVRRETTD